NDLKSCFGKSPSDVAFGAGTLVGMIQRYTRGLGWDVPKVLLICPPPLGKLTDILADVYAGAAEKSRQLAPYFQRVAKFYDCEFLDAGQVIVSSDRDGIHWDVSEHQKLGLVVAERVQQILG